MSMEKLQSKVMRLTSPLTMISDVIALDAFSHTENCVGYEVSPCWGSRFCCSLRSCSVSLSHWSFVGIWGLSVEDFSWPCPGYSLPPLPTSEVECPRENSQGFFLESLSSPHKMLLENRSGVCLPPLAWELSISFLTQQLFRVFIQHYLSFLPTWLTSYFGCLSYFVFTIFIWESEEI